MTSSAGFLLPSDAANHLGVSTKALRLYEQRGLVAPTRTEAGWRAYGPAEMARASEIVSLRALGLSLADIAHVLGGDTLLLEPALARQQLLLESRAKELAGILQKIRDIRAGLGQGQVPGSQDLQALLDPPGALGVAFDLPWPWGGERFELRAIRQLTYIIGPLGSGKTRLAEHLAKAVPGGAFLGLERSDNEAAAAHAACAADVALAARVEQTLAWLTNDGATRSNALMALVTGLEAEDATVIVVDMVEDGLDLATQQAVIAFLRRRGPAAKPLFLMTRSTAILHLDEVGPGEAIILCPANHSPPTLVAPYSGAPGYEAVATCLASPEVRERTRGVIAIRSPVA